tara:strand:- start:624 stop:842 length:219 start_codon:yes stop_codon:yes gene_type:complete
VAKNEVDKSYAVSLIAEMRTGAASNDRQQIIVSELDLILPDPNYWDYMVDHTPEMTPEEIVEKAFSYKPIML